MTDFWIFCGCLLIMCALIIWAYTRKVQSRPKPRCQCGADLPRATQATAGITHDCNCGRGYKVMWVDSNVHKGQVLYFDRRKTKPRQ